MKKLATILTAFVLLISASAFSKKDDTVSAKVKAEFEKNFYAATSVNWEKKESFYFATFKMKDQSFSAAYNDDGELLGVTRVISLSQLPLSVSLSIQNKYPDYTFGQSILEMNHDGQTTYYLDAENAKYRLKLSSNTSGNLSVEKKIRKK